MDVRGYFAGAALLLGTIPGIAAASSESAPDLLPSRFFGADHAESSRGEVLVAQAATPTPTPAPTATPAPEEGDPEFVFQDRPKRFPPLIWYEVSAERKSRGQHPRPCCPCPTARR